MKQFSLLLLLPLLIFSCKKDPSADFSYTGTLEVGQTITFNNLSKNVSTFSWDFGDGAVSTAESPSYTYPKPGNYTVTLTSEGNGKTVTASKLLPIEGTTYSYTNATTIPLYAFTTFYWTGTAIEEYHEHGTLQASQTTGIIISYRSNVLFAFKFVPEGAYYFSANPNRLTAGIHNEFVIDDNTPISGKGAESGSMTWYDDFMKLANEHTKVFKK